MEIKINRKELLRTKGAGLAKSAVPPFSIDQGTKETVARIVLKSREQGGKDDR